MFYASTSSVYGNNLKTPFKESHTADHPIQFYAAPKDQMNLLLMLTVLCGIETIGLRFFTVYGPWGRPDMALYKFVKNIIKRKKIEVFNYGNHKRDFTYIDDIVNGIILVINSNKIFKLKKIRKKNNFDPNISDCKFKIFNIGSGNQTSLMKYINIIEQELKIKSKKKYFSLQKGDIKKTLANISDLKKIGYKPKTNPKIGIKKFIKWYKEYYNVKK